MQANRGLWFSAVKRQERAYDQINNNAGSDKKAKENPMKGLLSSLAHRASLAQTLEPLSALKTISYK